MEDNINDIPEINVSEESEPIIEIEENNTNNEIQHETNENTNNEDTVEAPLEETSTASRHQCDIDELYFEDKIISNEENLNIPPTDIQNIRTILNNLPKLDLMNNEEFRKWAQTLQQSLDKESFNGVFKKALEDDSREFKQYVEHNGRKLAGARPRVKESTNQVFKGNKAIVSLMSYLGRGIHFQAPLWNSGIWITFAAPAETEILDLYRQLVSDKIEMGRYTYGLSLSNSTVYTVNRLVEFALDHIHSTNIKVKDDEELNLKDVILAQDIPSLLWGMACAMYPNGFKYSRACIDNPEKCNYIQESVLNLTKLQFTDTTSLSDYQKAHMSDRQPSCKDLEAIKRYQENHSKSINKTVKLMSDNQQPVSFTFKSPTITDYISAGYKWIQSTVDVIENSIVIPKDDEEKNKFIMENIKATAIRQYTHWVKEIEFENTVDDKETIEGILNYLSSDGTISDSFIKSVIEYIEMSTLSVIGIPNYTCPACNKDQFDMERETPFKKEVIPLDPIVVFTDLVMERTGIITAR